MQIIINMLVKQGIPAVIGAVALYVAAEHTQLYYSFCSAAPLETDQ